MLTPAPSGGAQQALRGTLTSDANAHPGRFGDSHANDCVGQRLQRVAASIGQRSGEGGHCIGFGPVIGRPRRTTVQVLGDKNVTQRGGAHC
jgi:hypothetical protein